MTSESPTHPDAPRAGGETPSEATLAEIRKGVEDARDGRVVDRGSFAAHASETPETRVDNLLRDFQNACEMVVVLGDSNLSETTKLRAVLRNQLRASLLERHRDGEREPLGVPRDAVQCDWCHAIFALEYATDDGLCTFCGGCTYALSVILATASAPPSTERAP